MTKRFNAYKAASMLDRWWRWASSEKQEEHWQMLDCFYHYYVDGMTYAEIADLMGLSRRKVFSNVWRAELVLKERP